LHSAIASDKTK